MRHKNSFSPVEGKPSKSFKYDDGAALPSLRREFDLSDCRVTLQLVAVLHGTSER